MIVSTFSTGASPTHVRRGGPAELSPDELPPRFGVPRRPGYATSKS
jgi:hypothetical protein